MKKPYRIALQSIFLALSFLISYFCVTGVYDVLSNASANPCRPGFHLTALVAYLLFVPLPATLFLVFQRNVLGSYFLALGFLYLSVYTVFWGFVFPTTFMSLDSNGGSPLPLFTVLFICILLSTYAIRAARPGPSKIKKWMRSYPGLLSTAVLVSCGIFAFHWFAAGEDMRVASAEYVGDYTTGLSYFDKEDYAHAFTYFLKSAKAGNPAAQNKAGDFYANGYAVKKNYDKAAEWYEKAIEHGQSDAYISLGAIYETGRGNIQKDVKKAFALYQSAMDGGNTYGHINCGRMFQEGLGVKQDYKKALQLYKQALSLGNSSACDSLGNMYEDGLGVNQNDERARQWYYQGALKGDLDSIDSLAYFYAEKNTHLDDAEKLAKGALQYEPGNGYYVDTLGWILFKQGKINASLEQLKKSERT